MVDLWFIRNLVGDVKKLESYRRVREGFYILLVYWDVVYENKEYLKEYDRG